MPDTDEAAPAKPAGFWRRLWRWIFDTSHLTRETVQEWLDRQL